MYSTISRPKAATVQLTRRRQHAHALHTEILQDLRSDTKGAQHRSRLIFAGILRRAAARRADRIGQLAWGLVMSEDNHHTARRLRHASHCLAQCPRTPANTTANTDQITQCVGQMHAHHDGLSGIDLAAHQRQMHIAIDVIFVAAQLEAAELGLDGLRRHAFHRTLSLQSIADQIGDGADAQVVCPREFLKLWTARHGAVLVHDLNDH